MLDFSQVADECTIRTNSPKFPQEGADQGCGQCSKKENHNHGKEEIMTKI